MSEAMSTLSQRLVSQWFEKWEQGDFHNLPITESFKHTSPFGTIEGKNAYTDLVASNKEKFLGHKFIVQDAFYGSNKACVRYTSRQTTGFELEVSEWYYFKDSLIDRIMAYYHIGEIVVERKLTL